MDLVPVDWVADVITHILCNVKASGAVCHLTAGPERAVPIEEITRLSAAHFDLRTPLKHPRKIQFLREDEFVQRFERWGWRGKRILEQLGSLLPYAMVDRLFDTTVTDRLLKGSGITFPDFREYAGRIFAYCIDSDWGRKPG
jgi:hypothetical protein